MVSIEPLPAAVDTLREAACLMRERAEAATPGPWHRPDAVPQLVGVIRSASNPDALVHGDDCGCGGGIGYEPDAVHITSWHPEVALRVADWLWSVADGVDRQIRNYPDRVPYIEGDALAVARSYLGARR